MATHKYVASSLDAFKCGICKHSAADHHCECCDNPNTEVELRYGTMLICIDCAAKEDLAQAEIMKPENVQARLNTVIERAKEVDNSIQVRSDLFNASTVSIIELKASIDNDDTIVNKPFELASVLMERFNHHTKVIFEQSEDNVKRGNDQKAIQVYLNNMANQLRAEEREKLKISDINYKPQVVKSVKPKTITTTGTRKSNKIDKAELSKYAKELGVNEFTLQGLVIAKGITVEAAANLLRRSLKEAQSESN